MKPLTVEDVRELGELGYNVLKEFRQFLGKYIKLKYLGMPELVQKQLGKICAAYALAAGLLRKELSSRQQERILSREEVLNAIISLKQLARELPELEERIDVIVGYLEKMI